MIEVKVFDVLKSPTCVLINPQPTILAIIGAQLMHSFNRNSPLLGGGSSEIVQIWLISIWPAHKEGWVYTWKKKLFSSCHLLVPLCHNQFLILFYWIVPTGLIQYCTRTICLKNWRNFQTLEVCKHINNSCSLKICPIALRLFIRYATFLHFQVFASFF